MFSLYYPVTEVGYKSAWVACVSTYAHGSDKKMLFEIWPIHTTDDEV